MSESNFQSNLQFLQVLDPDKKILVPFYANGLNVTFNDLFSDVNNSNYNKAEINNKKRIYTRIHINNIY